MFSTCSAAEHPVAAPLPSSHPIAAACPPPPLPPASRSPSTLHALVLTSAALYIFLVSDTFAAGDGANPFVLRTSLIRRGQGQCCDAGPAPPLASPLASPLAPGSTAMSAPALGRLRAAVGEEASARIGHASGRC